MHFSKPSECGMYLNAPPRCWCDDGSCCPLCSQRRESSLEAFGLNTHFVHLRFIGPLLFIAILLAGCNSTTTIVVTATATPTPLATATTAPTATATLPTATPTSAPADCNPTVPTPYPGGPDTSFQYPPLTTHSGLDGAAGHEYYGLCSSGDPTLDPHLSRTLSPRWGLDDLGHDLHHLERHPYRRTAIRVLHHRGYHRWILTPVFLENGRRISIHLSPHVSLQII